MFETCVSVVINTTNRGFHLKRLLDCLKYQTYDNFEVIVVNGPSSDNTDEILNSYSNAIRIEKCPDFNLCKSRNIGLKAAAGDILAFIDDDAVPEDRFWLENAVKYFSDPSVGLVGGASYRINGDVEFRYGRCSIWGDNETVCPSPAKHEESDGEWFPRAQGNNMFVLREAAVRVGGFDEYYEYFLDESDLAIRIQQTGYIMRYAENCSVIHEAAKGAFRKSEFDLKWDIIAKSQGYFVMKFSESSSKSIEERKRAAESSVQHWLDDFENLLSSGTISEDEQQRYSSMVVSGAALGINDGIAGSRKLDFNIAAHPKDFKKYSRKTNSGEMNICFLCEDNVLYSKGGVQTYTKALAYGLSSRGHNVYIICRGEREVLSNIGGVNFCMIAPEKLKLPALYGKPLANSRADFSYGCYQKLQQLKKSFYIDIVESPIWDSYGFVSSYLEKEVPIVTRLQTPLKMVIETFNMENSADLELLTEYESALLENSAAIITISDCVKQTIEELYDMSFSQPVYKNYLGISPERLAVSSRGDDERLEVFYIGRLERRKGIDSIISALPQLMQKYDNLDFYLAGDYSIYDEVIGDTYKHKFETENKDAAWMDRVHFLGKISDEEREQHFADCDVFVAPSLYESFGLIFIEAMRYGKSVIGCSVGGMKEVVKDGVTGILCQPGSPDSFRESLESLLNDKRLRENMGEAGLERLNELFTEEKMCEICEKIFRNVIMNRK